MADWMDEFDAALGYGKSKEVAVPKGTAKPRLGDALQAKADAWNATADEFDKALGYGKHQAKPVPETDSQRLDKLSQTYAGGVPKAAAEPTAPGYGMADRAINAVTLGLGDKALALGMGGDYGKAKDYVQAARTQWAGEHPGGAIVADVAGAAIPTVGITGALGQAGGNLLAQAMPKAAPGVTRFLSGLAGAEAPGLGGLATRVGSQAASGALSGATGAAIQAPLNEGGLGEQVGTGAAAGAALGPVLNPLVHAFTMAGKSVPPAVAQAGQKLLDRGIPISGAQMIGKAPGTEHQLQRVTEEVAKTFGGEKSMEALGVRALTPEVVDHAKDAIGQKFSDFVTKYSTPFDTKAGSEVVGAIKDTLAKPGLADTTKSQVTDVGKFVVRTVQQAMAKNGGALDGESFRALTATNGPLGHIFASQDPVLREFGHKIKDSMYDLVGRTAPPEAADLINEARNQWRNFKSVEKVVTKAQGTGGIVDPQSLAGVLGRKGISDEVRDLAQGARMLPKTTAQGGPPAETAWNKAASVLDAAKTGGPLGYLTALGVTEPASLGNVASMIKAAPTGPTALLGALGGAATVAAGRSLMQNYANSPGFARKLIERSLDPNADTALRINPLIAPFAPAWNYGGK